MGERQSGINTAEALKRFPDENAESACVGAKLVDSVRQNWEGRRLSKIFQSRAETALHSRPETAFQSRAETPFQSRAEIDKEAVDIVRSSLGALTEEERQRVPDGAKTYLSGIMPYTRAADDLRGELFKQGENRDWGFLAWQEERQAKMFREIDKDPLIRDAQKRWSDPDFSDTEKMRVAERIQEIQAGAFGVATVPMTVDPDLDGWAIYRLKSKSIALSGGQDGSLTKEDFPEFVDTVTHETAHSIQHQITERYSQLKTIEDRTLKDLQEKSVHDLSPEGKAVYQAEYDRRLREAFPDGDPNGFNEELGPEGRLRRAAPLFIHSGKFYMTPASSGFENYTANPVEQDAWAFGRNAAKFIRQDAEGRAEMINRLEGNSQIDNRLHQDTVASRNQARVAPQMCPA